MNDRLNDLKLSPYISAEQIQTRVKEIAQKLNQKYKNEPVIAICVLKGSFLFYSDLIRQLDCDVRCDFIAVSSYEGTQSSGEVRMTLDLHQSVAGHHVLLVEDIVDTGLTMSYLQSLIRAKRPKTVTTVALLEKPEALKVPCEVDEVGFKIRNDFVVGYGLDYQGKYRHLNAISQVQDLQ